MTGEGDPYRPESLFWLGAQGEVLGHSVGKPGELVERACESLSSTIARPLMGRPHAPDRLRVASAELAEVLCAGFPELEVVCAATPELDAIIAAMREQVKDRAELLQTYRPSAVEPAAIAAFFRAAAALYRARPWEIVPSGENIFSISIEKLGVTAAALSVVGQMGQSLGLIRFASAADFDAFLEAVDELEPGASPPIPRHFALTFERGAELSAALREEIAEHHWELADASAYPWLVTVEADLVARPPTTEELAIAEAIALALPKVLEEKQALLGERVQGDGAGRRRQRDHRRRLRLLPGAPRERRPAARQDLQRVLGADGLPPRHAQERAADARSGVGRARRGGRCMEKFIATPIATDWQFAIEKFPEL